MFTIFNLTIHTYQILIPIMAIIGIYILHTNYKNHNINLGFYICGLVFGILLTLIAFSFNFTTTVSNLIGIKRGLDLLIIFTVGLLLCGIYLISNRIDKTGDRINNLIEILEKDEK